MNKNKKFVLTEVLFLVIPITLAFVNAIFSNYYYFQWGYRHVNEISMAAFSLAILGNIYIYWQNRKNQPPSKIWGFASLFLVAILAVLLYIGNSISHFGF